MSIKQKYLGDKKFYIMALTVAVPIMIQNGITNFVSLLDNIMVGAVGTVEMTGVSITNTLMFVFNLAVFGAVSGVGIFSAQFYGKGDHKGIRDTMRYKLVTCAVLLTVAIGAFLLFGEGLIRLYLTGDGDVTDIEGSLSFGTSYLRIMLWGLPAFVLGQCYASTLRETGQTVPPMTAGIVAVVVNLFLNWLLIFGNWGAPKLGSDGAAIATVVSRYVELAIVALWTHRKKDKCSYAIGLYKSFKVPSALCRSITLKGLPLLFNEALWSAGIAITSQCYSTKGYHVMAAVNINSALNNVCNVTYLAMGMAISIIVGQLLGAGEKEKAKEYARKLTVFSILTSFASTLILILLSGVFPGIYETSEEVRSLATSLIMATALIMPFCALSNACYFTLRCGGKTWLTILFDSVFACVIVAPTAFLLSRFTSLSIVPLFICCQGLETVKCVIGVCFVKSGIWVHNLVSEN